jgi:hypothetical protein
VSTVPFCRDLLGIEGMDERSRITQCSFCAILQLDLAIQSPVVDDVRPRSIGIAIECERTTPTDRWWTPSLSRSAC